MANAVSADGRVIVGGSDNANSYYEAFCWTSDGGIQGIGELGGGAFYSKGLGISADGSTIVGESTSALGEEAFRWTSAGGMEALGDLPGAGFQSRAFAASADGMVVVGAGSSADGNNAFIWTPAGGMRSLRDVLVDDYGMNLDGWTLRWASGISADGCTIVGGGFNPLGQNEAWIAVIPEPTALPILCCVVAATLRRRRRGKNPDSNRRQPSNF